MCVRLFDHKWPLPPWRGWVLAIGLGFVILGPLPHSPLRPTLVQAQALRPELRDPFLADPLEDDPRDPLLPMPLVDRPLSPLELLALEADLDERLQAAEALLAAGQDDEAIALWLQDVRLRRLLGVDAELAAMQRLAPRLRDRNATESLQLLSLRLEVVQAALAAADSLTPERQLLLADTYRQLGNAPAAIALHQNLADQAQAAGNLRQYQTQLETVADLEARQFAFAAAATAYGDLADLAQTAENQRDETRYLKARIHNLEQGQRLEPALEAQQRLLALYTADESQWPLIPPLQHQMAQNYRGLGNLDTASRSYQAAYINAIDQDQFNVAAEAIRELADLYKTLERWADVRYLYEQLILVEQQAFSAYGLMDAFDQLGQLYEIIDDPEAALEAYREGLILARHLNHRQDYFEMQIDRLTEETT